MQGVRVLRLLEYEYPDVEAAEEDMARWTTSSPPSNRRMRMRSSTMPFVAIDWDPPHLFDEFTTAPQAFATGIADRSHGVAFTDNPYKGVEGREHLRDAWWAGWDVDHDAEVRSLERRGQG